MSYRSTGLAAYGPGSGGIGFPTFDTVLEMNTAIAAGDINECDVAKVQADGDYYAVVDGEARNVCEGQQISSGGVSVSASDLFTDDSIVLLAPRADWPFLADYADTLPEDDWYSKAIPDVSQESIGLWYLTNEEEDLSDYLHVSNPFSGIGNVFHHGTPTAAAQLRGEMTFSSLYEGRSYSSLSYGGTNFNSLGAVRGMGDPALADENVLWELLLQTRDTLRYHHEAAIDVNVHVDWHIPFRLREGFITHFAFTRDASGAVTVYLDGYKLQRLTVVDNATDNGDGTATGSNPPENGTNSVNMVQRRPDYPLLKYWHVQDVARAVAEIEAEAGTWASVADPNIAAAALSNADILAELETGNELEFFIADPDEPNGILQRKGVGVGDWSSTGTSEDLIGPAAYWGFGGTSENFVNTNTSWSTCGGGADFVYRFLFIHKETSYRARWFALNQSPGNWLAHLTAESSTRLRFIQQHGSKVQEEAFFDGVEALENGRVYLISVEQADNGDGTQDVTVRVNGTVWPCSSVSGGSAVDNGDFATLTNGNEGGAIEMSLMGSPVFGNQHLSLFRALQIDQGATSGATELAHAQALGLA